MLILSMIKVAKLSCCCCCAKTHVSLYRISGFEISAYLCENHEVVDDYCSKYVHPTCHVIEYVLMVNFMKLSC